MLAYAGIGRLHSAALTAASSPAASALFKRTVLREFHQDSRFISTRLGTITKWIRNLATKRGKRSLKISVETGATKCVSNDGGAARTTGQREALLKKNS